MSHRISRRANADIEKICDYIAQDNPEAAEQMDARFHAAIQQLAAFPGMGHTRADVSDKRYLFWAVGKYLTKKMAKLTGEGCHTAKPASSLAALHKLLPTSNWRQLCGRSS